MGPGGIWFNVGYKFGYKFSFSFPVPPSLRYLAMYPMLSFLTKRIVFGVFLTAAAGILPLIQAQDRQGPSG